MSTTFAISDVPVSARRFHMKPSRDAFQQLLARKKTLAPQSVRTGSPALAVSFDAQLGDITRTIPLHSGVHPLFYVLTTAFNDHLPVSLSPDHIWALVLQGISQHINHDPEAHRHRFVAHEGTQTIAVRRDDFVFGEDNPWEETFPEFVAKIRAHIGPQADAFVAPFSTTGEVESSVFHLLLMDTVKEYFSYEFHTMCGIPSMTLEGEPADWEALHTRLDLLHDYDMTWWHDRLAPICEQLFYAASGDVDRAFWRSMVKINDVSGGPYYTGWLVHLCPYIVKSRWDDQTRSIHNYMARNELLDTSFADLIKAAEQSHFGGPSLTDEAFPPAVHDTPFVWKYLGDERNMVWRAGFLGFSQDDASGTLRPELGWAVLHDRAA